MIPRIPLLLIPLAAMAQTPAPVPSPVPSPVASPVPSAESPLTGSIDLGYRWRTDVAGSADTYRSIVNLGSGPKLLGTDFSLAKTRLFDHLHVRASSWGDEPYATLHLDAVKAKRYDFTADYRDIAYFNFLPSYADPLLGRGIVLNEQSFDQRRRFAGFSLDLLPGNWFVPYLAFDRDSGSGTGASVFVSDGNEYPVPNTLHDRTSLYRGGVRFDLRRVHATLEEGGTVFSNDQSLFSSSKNAGNVLNPVLGQTLSLNNLLATYGIHGSSAYSKGLFTANAASWLDVYGQFRYSQPDTNVNYQQTATGNFYLQNQAIFYTSQQYLLSAAAKLPHTSASLGAEIRPLRRIRILESWTTDRLHDSSSASQTGALLASTLVTNYNQQEVNVIADATSKLTLRGGYRYVWGDASEVTLPAAGLASADHGHLKRHVGLGGVTYRATRKISFSADGEAASSDGVYFRTSLYEYQKVRAQARYQALNSLTVSADFNALSNQNPMPSVRYDYRSHQESLALFWSPKSGKTFTFQGAYTHSALRADIDYLSPQDLAAQQSRYRELAHTGTALVTINARRLGRTAPKLTAGGSFFRGSGSRPTAYFQPLAKLWIPVGRRANWFTEWRYYGYGEAFYLYEGFRTHSVTTGLRITR